MHLGRVSPHLHKHGHSVTLYKQGISLLARICSQCVRTPINSMMSMGGLVFRLAP